MDMSAAKKEALVADQGLFLLALAAFLQHTKQHQQQHDREWNA